METLYAWLFTMALGFDTLVVSASLGLKKEPKDKVKIALVFAAAESVMPIFGIVIGGALGRYFHDAAAVVGALLLIGVAIYFLAFDDEDGGKGLGVGGELAGWPLMLAAISISLDELAVGFAAGFVQAPIVLTILLIASRSFVFTFAGAAFGAKIRPYLGEWAEKTSGVLLGGMGLWMLMEILFDL